MSFDLSSSDDERGELQVPIPQLPQTLDTCQDDDLKLIEEEEAKLRLEEAMNEALESSSDDDDSSSSSSQHVRLHQEFNGDDKTIYSKSRKDNFEISENVSKQTKEKLEKKENLKMKDNMNIEVEENDIVFDHALTEALEEKDDDDDETSFSQIDPEFVEKRSLSSSLHSSKSNRILESSKNTAIGNNSIDGILLELGDTFKCFDTNRLNTRSRRSAPHIGMVRRISSSVSGIAAKKDNLESLIQIDTTTFLQNDRNVSCRIDFHKKSSKENESSYTAKALLHDNDDDDVECLVHFDPEKNCYILELVDFTITDVRESRKRTRQDVDLARIDPRLQAKAAEKQVKSMKKKSSKKVNPTEIEANLNKDVLARKKMTKPPKSGFFGVTAVQRKTVECGMRYQAKVFLDGKYKSLGIFDKAIEAAKKYDSYVCDHDLDKALNFPHTQESTFPRPDISENY